VDRSDNSGSLTHYGVKGMKWGVTHDPAGHAVATPARARASDDARTVENAQVKIQAHGTRALSNKELQTVINRMNMENQYHNLTNEHRELLDSGHQQVKKILAYGATIEKARKFAESPTGMFIRKHVGKVASVGLAYVSGGGTAAAAAGARVFVPNMLPSGK